MYPKQAKRKEKDMSISRRKMGGYRMDCQKVAEERRDLRSKSRKRTSWKALTRGSMIPLLRLSENMAEARTMKRSNIWWRGGWIARAANASVVT